MLVQPGGEGLGAQSADAGDGGPPVGAVGLDEGLEVAQRLDAFGGQLAGDFGAQPLTDVIAGGGRTRLCVRSLDQDVQDARGDRATGAGAGEGVGQSGIGHDCPLDEVMAHGGEKFFHPVHNLWSVFAVVQLGDFFWRDALNPSAHGGEVGARVARGLHVDVCVLCHAFSLVLLCRSVKA